jgi:SAM-dependent methyltransferase
MRALARPVECARRRQIASAHLAAACHYPLRPRGWPRHGPRTQARRSHVRREQVDRRLIQLSCGYASFAMDDTIRSYYEHYWTPEGYNPTRQQTPAPLRAIFDRYVRSTDDCLDVGCGDGGTGGFYLAENARSYVGVDISEHAVQLASSRGLAAKTIEDASHLPFAGESFDVVLCVEVLEHLFEPQLAAAEAARVLRSGGRFIATVPNGAYWRDRVDMLFGAWQPGGDDLGRREPWRSPHIRFFRPASLAEMLRQSGFTSVTVEGIPGPLLGRVPILRSVNRRTGPVAIRLAEVRPSFFAPGLLGVGRL